ncbi:MAG: nucleoside kinase, partial [Lachnospiraceae bacterium]|nr:nucleoside kinase [Lachnospiraceae bacterium]
MSTVKISVKDKVYDCSTEGTLLELAKKAQADYPSEIVLAEYDHKLTELCKHTSHDGTVKFLTTGDKNGRRAYRRSMVMLMQRAIDTVYNDSKVDVRVISSFGSGYYCEMADERKIDEDLLDKLRAEMKRLVELDLPIKKYVQKTDEAKKIFKREGLNAKGSLLKYRSSSNINIYELDGFMDYFYGYMVPSTGYLKYFDLAKFGDGFVLLFPSKKDGVTM